MRNIQPTSKRTSLNFARDSWRTSTKREVEHQNALSTTDNTPVREKPVKSFKALGLPRNSRISHLTSDSASTQPNKLQIDRTVQSVVYSELNNRASNSEFDYDVLKVQTETEKAELALSEAVSRALLLRLELLRTLESGYQILCLKSLN